ncbi:hypothetical protein JOM49_003752 [Amycolatopsis magusensis]|uniref:AraC-type transcription regulator ligand-binding domain-containing protein n=1 Tax=Amycolatopsis magusensis TaxID=882444 RepID=A0ABS4PS39_9PSEU|nr:hypothetical protein [Amycolatopsis magusensis]
MHRVWVDGDWCTRVDAFQGAGFYVVLKGNCWLLTDGGESISLDAGAAVLLPHGAGHVVAARPTDVETARRKAVPFERRLAESGSEREGTEVLCGGTGSTAAACTPC